MNNCGCSPGEVCDVCDPAGVDAAIAAGHIPMDVDLPESYGAQEGGFNYYYEDQEPPAEYDGDDEPTRLAAEQSLMHNHMMENIAQERGVELDDLDGYFDASNNWVDLGTPERKGTMGKPGSDKRHRGN